MKKNIFLTGPPSSEKTAIIKKVIKKLGLPANGFYTEEERASGKRLGFLMKTHFGVIPLSTTGRLFSTEKKWGDLPDGRGDVSGRLHSVASRYGRITFSTRQILAYLSSSPRSNFFRVL